jgi:CheY-like chemotaxis protein
MTTKSRQEQIVVLIDDDPISNILTELNIKTIHESQPVFAYTDHELGINKIKSIINSDQGNAVILFLDINMPTMSGWEVLDILGKYLEEAGNKYLRIYMLSSSIDVADKLQAYSNPWVSGYFEKPMTPEDFGDLLFKKNYL